VWADNGINSEFFVADNDNSSTRFRFTGAETFDAFKIGFTMEFEAQRNASNLLDIGQDNDGDFEFNERWLEAYFETNLGKLSVGKGSGAADNTAEVDLSGTAVIMYAGVGDTAAGFTFYRKDGTSTGTSVGDTRDDFDGLGRNNRIRYDSPVFSGFQVAGSITNGDAYELSGWYTGDFGNLGKLAAAAGYVDTQHRKNSAGAQLDYDQINASASWLLPFGLNFTASWGRRSFNDARSNQPTAKNYYFKVGYKFGVHALAGELGRTDDLDQSGDESSNFGLAYVMTPWDGVEFYAAGRLYELDRPGERLHDISQLMAGTRIKF
jgi:hypothetical protein